jgi:hypothetical protein
MSGGIAHLLLNLGTRREHVVSITPLPPLPPGKPGTHCTGGWVYRCGKFRPTGIRSPDLPARSESLYRLSYPGLDERVEEIFIVFCVIFITCLVMCVIKTSHIHPSARP